MASIEESSRFSLAALLAANLIPIIGIILFDWQVGDVMLLYWSESAVIGLFNFAKMWLVGRWQGVGLGLFFLFHYGCFMAGHLFFLYAFMIPIPEGQGDHTMAGFINDLLMLIPAFIALLISHGVSFYFNYLGNREYEGRTLNQQMNEPYGRIIVMHLTLIAGGGLVIALDSPMPALILMIVLKVAADVFAHIREHKKKPIDGVEREA